MDKSPLSQTINKIKSFFIEEDNGKVASLEQIQNLNKTVAEHGWYSTIDTTHVCFFKSYIFDSKEKASEFLLNAFYDKASSSVHLDICQKPSKLDIIVYADEASHSSNECLETCLLLDEEYEELK